MAAASRAPERVSDAPPMSARAAIAWANRLPQLAQDGLLAAVVTGLHVLALATFDPSELPPGTDGRAIDAGAYAIVVVTSAPLLFRRRYPLAAFAAATAGLLLFAWLQYIGPFTGYAMLVGLYSVVVHRGVRPGLTAGAVTLASVLSAYVLSPYDADAATVGFDLLVVTTAVALGDGTRNRLAASREHEARMAELAQDQSRAARQAVLDERTRIARELHDLVAHSMSIIAVQAGVGHHLIDHDATKAKEALATIETTSRQALTEMRRMLGVLRTDEAGPDAELNPQPSLDDLDGLVRQARGAGLEVDLRVEGEPQCLSAGVALSAYRIIQEALTNAVKHAGPARVDVLLRYDADALHIAVDDDGRGMTTVHAGRRGYGLLGMRERAAVVGGALDSGARPGGGFRVSAHLPYDEAAP